MPFFPFYNLYSHFKVFLFMSLNIVFNFSFLEIFFLILSFKIFLSFLLISFLYYQSVIVIFSFPFSYRKINTCFPFVVSGSLGTSVGQPIVKTRQGSVSPFLSHIHTHTYQGSKEITQWPINLCTSPIIMHKITPSVDYIY